MKIADLSKMQNGWFVGNFHPSILKSSEFEVGLKTYSKGEKEAEHVHRAVSEITVVVSGKIMMRNTILEKGQMILLEPNESSSFEALEKSELIVIKCPSIPDDKFVL